MAEALRPGGVYQVGKDRFVDANGAPVEAPARKELDAQRKADAQAERQLQEAAAAQQQPAGPAAATRRREG